MVVGGYWNGLYVNLTHPADKKPKVDPPAPHRLRKMSAEQLKAFDEAAKTDASLQEKLKEAGDVHAVVAIAKENGYEISEADIKAAQSEISEDALEHANGGAGIHNYSPVVIGGSSVPFPQKKSPANNDQFGLDNSF